MSERYPTILVKFMSFKDDRNYDKDTVFTGEDLLAISPSDVCRWLNLRAYGDPDPTPTMKPVFARSSTLEFDKKAISSFMPRQSVSWDPVSNRGNPTRSDDVNKLIKEVKRREVRREGVKSSARRPIEFDEFVNVLSVVRSVVDRAAKKFMVASVLTLQWHLIARIDDMMKLRFADFSPNIQHQGTLVCQMRWSKNILEERDAPEQIVVGSLDTRLCPLLSLAVYLESSPSATSSEFLFGNPSDGDRVVRRALQTAFSDSAFDMLKNGNMGTHSLRKGSATYGARSGLSKDYVNRRGRWRGRKTMVDTYIDNTQPYPDACAAAVLAGPHGPCRYLPKRGLAFISRSFLVSEIAPVANQVLGPAIAETLAAALLWAAIEYHSRPTALIPAQLQSRIIHAYVQAGGSLSTNGVSRESFHVVGDGSELQLVSVCESESSEVNEPGIDRHTPTGMGSEYTRRQCAALQTQLFSLKRFTADVLSEVLRSRSDTQTQLQRLSMVLKRLAATQALFTGRSQRSPEPGQREASANGTVEAGRAPARLSKRPKDLYELWHEFEFGLGGQKAAKEFTPSERGSNKFSYSRRKLFWDTVAALVRAGFTSDSAIDRVYAAYGRQTPVSSVLVKLREDKRRGGHPSLRV